MKKFLLFIALSFVLITPVLALNLGGDLQQTAASQAGYAEVDSTSFAKNIGLVIKVFLSFIGVIFLAYMVFAGFQWMTAHGEEEKVKKAQTIIKQCIIGLIITVAAYSITSFVVPKILERTASGGIEQEGRPMIPTN